MIGTCVVLSTILFVLMDGSSAEMKKLKLNNGNEMPAIALGTYLGFDQNGMVKSENKKLRDVVLQAIDIGYRHFDTASIYGTEAEIAEAVRMKIEEGAVKREDIFITTKLWNTHHRREQVVESLRNTLEKMGLGYVDLFLMHWPMAINEDHSYSNVDYMETWQGLEDVQGLGLAKSVGLSNFNKEQLERVIKEGSVKPAVLQIEIHPQIIQSELVDYCHTHDIVVMAYSPLGSLVSRYGMQFPGPKIDDPKLSKIANKYGKTTPQVVLRWLVDRNIVPVPKSVNPSRLKQNIDIFNFQLNKEEIEEINKFDSHTRFTLPSFWQNHLYYPFDKVKSPIKDPFQSK